MPGDWSYEQTRSLVGVHVELDQHPEFLNYRNFFLSELSKNLGKIRIERLQLRYNTSKLCSRRQFRLGVVVTSV